MSDIIIASKPKNIDSNYTIGLYEAKVGDKLQFKGGEYTITRDKDGKPKLSKEQQSSLKSFCEFFTHRLFEGSFRSRASRMNDIVGVPADQRHFRVDVDKNLLYRTELPNGKTLDNFTSVKLQHAKHGTLNDEGQRMVNTNINNKMLEFLINQKKQGAKVSITSTGGWVESDIKKNLGNLNLTIDEFDNKKTLNGKSLWTAGFAQKFRVLGNEDLDGKKNIMMDDQLHQRFLFKRNIDAKDFGMG